MPGEPSVSIVLLAAGLSDRMGGRNKLLLPLGGKPLVRRAAEAACGAGAREVVAVTGHEGEEVAAALAGLPLRRVHNPDYARGQASSLQAGLREVDPRSRGVMFLLGDQPLVDATLLRRLIAAFEEAGEPKPLAVLPVREGRRGNPVVLNLELRGELEKLEGDTGARPLLERLLASEPGRLLRLEVEGEAAFADVDREEDYRRLVKDIDFKEINAKIGDNPLHVLPPLAAPAERAIALVEEARLRAWVEAFAEPRHTFLNPGAHGRARERMREALSSLGLGVEEDPFWFGFRTYSNLLARLDPPGGSPGAGAPWILIGAHFDGALGTPGADDNASGLAALLEAARAVREAGPARPTLFAAFDLEELGYRGSRHLARRARRERWPLEGMLCLESVGYASDAPGSQHLPRGIGIPVPERGDFLGVVGNRRSARLVESFLAAAGRFAPELPLRSHLVFGKGRLLPPTRRSDHSPFWDRGFQAAMLTDTANFRNPNYHRATDTPDTLNFSFLAGVTRALVAWALSPGEG